MHVCSGLTSLGSARGWDVVLGVHAAPGCDSAASRCAQLTIMGRAPCCAELLIALRSCGGVWRHLDVLCRPGGGACTLRAARAWLAQQRAAAGNEVAATWPPGHGPAPPTDYSLVKHLVAGCSGWGDELLLCHAVSMQAPM
jgi:hypothetical protein